MRIHLRIKKTDKLIPFNHQSKLTGVIHKWLGLNKEHGQLSLYSFSRFEGAIVTRQGIKFEKDITFFFSAHDPDLIKLIISGIQNDNTLFDGLEVFEIIIEEDPDLSNIELFLVASPILIKRRIEDKIVHITYWDSRASQFLKETLQHKMEMAGFIDDSFMIDFQTNYINATTKLIDYNGIKNRANWCPVIIKAKTETKQFAWNVGLGNSTGIGFGAIK